MAYHKQNKIIAILSLASIIMLAGCGRMSSVLTGSNSTNTSEPQMTSVMRDGQSTPQMQAARGTNTSTLFSENIRSDSKRLDRLEHAVQGLRNEFDAVRPSIDRLVSIEEDVQTLIEQLEVIANGPTEATEATSIQPTMKKALPSAKPSTTLQAGAPQIQSIRLGEHPGKTRLVLDVNAPISFTADIDNTENILVIDVKQANWAAAPAKTFKNSAFVSSYKIQPSDNGAGSLVLVQLKKAAKIAYKDSLKALKGKGQRLVIDLSQ